MRRGALWLVGMMGAGKSAVGRILADRLGIPYADVDDEVASRLGCSISELWGQRGEAAFRDLETAQVARLATKAPLVISTGGGVVLRADNVATMRASGAVVWLTASPTTLASRVGRGEGRPLLAEGDPATRLAEILEERRGHYTAAAHHTVDTDGRNAAEVADDVEALWNES